MFSRVYELLGCLSSWGLPKLSPRQVVTIHSAPWNVEHSWPSWHDLVGHQKGQSDQDPSEASHLRCTIEPWVWLGFVASSTSCRAMWWLMSLSPIICRFSFDTTRLWMMSFFHCVTATSYSSTSRLLPFGDYWSTRYFQFSTTRFPLMNNCRFLGIQRAIYLSN